jgi:hypothetical protein
MAFKRITDDRGRRAIVSTPDSDAPKEADAGTDETDDQEDSGKDPACRGCRGL